MRRLTWLMKIFAVIFAIISTAQLAVAHEQEQTNTDEMAFIKNINLTVYNSLTTERVIQCFDVNDNGWFAIGYKTNDINIYDETGTFKYGYHFNCQGDYGVSLLAESLAIYFVRGDAVAVFDFSGQLVSFQNTTFSNDFLDTEIYRTTKKIDNTTYSLERDIGIFRGDYSRLIAVNEVGDKLILYDATGLGYLSGILHYLILLSIPVLLIVSIAPIIKKEEGKTD